MDEQIRQIAERLRGLRDAMELSTAEVARDCGIDQAEYERAESGEHDISVSMLQQIARHYGIALDALMFGEEPKMSTYFVTRAGRPTPSSSPSNRATAPCTTTRTTDRSSTSSWRAACYSASAARN